jgi:hypothetical protein
MLLTLQTKLQHEPNFVMFTPVHLHHSIIAYEELRDERSPETGSWESCLVPDLVNFSIYTNNNNNNNFGVW